MSEQAGDSGGPFSVRTAELVVAGLLCVVGAVVMWDSWRIGATWGDDGPRAGYFPFYVGLIILGSSLGTLLMNLFSRSAAQRPFVAGDQLMMVLKVLIPAVVFVIAVGFLGIYVAAALYIAFFMWWLGGYGPVRFLPVAILVPLALFVMFEIWFLVPLPKGPLEAWLGY
jgi:putative tricarboxylic transport membrane protein